ncbi:unnamed protein product [Protopolystoma xenopodis]|uniref:Secreted protein n=1 Tax=Protopolystoma xenopodis TaxID=117903 RepID=A0A448XK35_9PLAT|nr:unnamed protein product [Protopolystoma xenopodis]
MRPRLTYCIAVGSSLIRLLTTASRCHWPAGETFAASSPPSTHLALPTAHSRKSLTGVTRSLTRSQARKHTRHHTNATPSAHAGRQTGRRRNLTTVQPCNRATVRPVNNSTTQLAAMIKCLVNSYVRPTFRAEAPLPNGRALERAYRPIE